MPLFGTRQAGGTLAALIPGEEITLFNAETITAPQASIAFARGYNPGGTSGFAMTFQVEFAASPTTAAVQILGTNKQQLADGTAITLADWTVLVEQDNTQTFSYTDEGSSAFYCVYVASQSAGGAITATVKA